MNINEKITLRGEGKCGVVPIERPVDREGVKEFFKHLNWAQGDLKGELLYVQSKTISQSKLREAGFSITRSKEAGIIVINNFKERWGIDQIGVNEVYNDLHHKYTYVLDSDLYKYLYKYKGNQELYKNLDELFKSSNRDNTKIAMEMMANADWSGNEIYLQELFANYYIKLMRGTAYKNSISFQGFLISLDFNYEGGHFYVADDYRDLAKNDEQHQWIFDKYKDSFEEELNDLFKKNKVKIVTLKYEIDKDLLYNED